MNARSLIHGAAAGLAGGVVFGAMMGMMGMLPMIGKMVGAVALGPVGIAAFFADVSVGKKDPCAVALESAEQKDQPSHAEKAEGSSKDNTVQNEKKKEKKTGAFFKRLFGK